VTTPVVCLVVPRVTKGWRTVVRECVGEHSLYHAFTSKQRLFLAVLRRYEETWTAR
jgi:hypothetical protein